MPIRLHMHPFASFCMKVIVGFHETETPFDANVVDLSDPAQREALVALWPFGKFPVMEDEQGGIVAESTMILEWLATHRRSKLALLPANPDQAREVRFRDRFFDLYVDQPMQTIVAQFLRPKDQPDPFGVKQARATLATAYDFVEKTMKPSPWAYGEAFTMADCAAAPALWYANRVQPFEASHPRTFAYLQRLVARPSFARVIRDAEPFEKFFPYRHDEAT